MSRSLGSTRLRTAWLVLASCVFYSQWSALLLGVVLTIVAVDYAIALEIERSHGRRRRGLLGARGTARHQGLSVDVASSVRGESARRESGEPSEAP